MYALAITVLLAAAVAASPAASPQHTQDELDAVQFTSFMARFNKTCVLATHARLLDIPIIRTAEPNVPWNVFSCFAPHPLSPPPPTPACHAPPIHTHSYAAEAERTRRFAVFQGNLRKCERMNVDEGEEVFGVTKFSVSKFQS